MEKQKKFCSLKHKISYDTNPFIIELKDKMILQPRVNTFIARGEKIVDSITGEILDEHLLLGRRKIIDKSQFTKLYVAEISILYNLSKTAMNVLLHFMTVMDFENKVLFHYGKEFKKTGYKSPSPCLKGIKELMDVEVIAAHTINGVYWINPCIVCKGERFATYTEYLMSSKNEITNNQITKKEN